MECISKYQAYSALRSEAAEHEFPASKEAFERAARIIDQIPAADVREVRRGEWKINSDGYYPYCSVCGCEPRKMSKYCPDCGAEMCGGDSNV